MSDGRATGVASLEARKQVETAKRARWRSAWLGAAYLTWLPWTAVLLGAVLRIRNWLHDRSLWLDEILIANNIIHRGFGRLTHPLGSMQAAPAGWLWAERVSIRTFGANEYALRLVPLLSSLLALAVFPLAARLLVGSVAAPVATVLFATSPALIYFAAETKQYSSDVTCTLLALVATAPLLRSPPTVRRALLWGLACSALSWFSFPALAVAGLCGIVVAARWIRQLPALLTFVAGGALLVASVVAEYAVALRALSKDAALATWWQRHGGYPPSPSTVGSSLRWLRDAVLDVVRDPGHLSAPLLVVVVASWGLVNVARWRADAGVLVAVPIVAAVGLAVTRHYPMSMRVALYVVPSLLLLLAAGVVGIVTTARSVLRLIEPSWPVAAAAAVVAAGLLVVTAGGTSVSGVRKLVHPDEVTSGREAVAFVARHRQPGDLILVEAPWGNGNFDFYGPRFGLSRSGTFRFLPRACGSDAFAHLRGSGRVWLVFAHLGSGQPQDRNKIYLSQFETEASLLRSFHAAGDAGAYLLDFAAPPIEPRAPIPAWPHAGCLSVSVAR